MIELIGHRGYPAVYPENTILSFRKAIDAGCTGIELDLQLSKDNKVVVIHDKTLERTTNGDSAVRDHTLKELKKLDAGRGEGIPALDEVLSDFSGLVFLLELKVYYEEYINLCEEALKIVKNKRDALRQVIFTSFSPLAVKKIKELEPNAQTGLIFSKPWPPEGIYSLKGFIDTICPRGDRLDSIVSKFAEQNKLRLYVWTIDNKDEVEEAKKYNITGIVSNNPGEVKKYI